ncbi:hypothetical protein V8F20_003278 [Naviculisporaceae sp. PSN 640]
MCVIFLNYRLYCGVEGHAQAGFTQTKQTPPCVNGTNCNSTTIEWATESITDPGFKDFCPECNNPPPPPPREARQTGGDAPKLPDGPIVVPSLDPRIEEPSAPPADEVKWNDDDFELPMPQQPARPARATGYVPMDLGMIANLLGEPEE